MFNLGRFASVKRTDCL